MRLQIGIEMRTLTTFPLGVAFVGMVAGALASSAPAFTGRMSAALTGRLITNATRYAKEHPEDASTALLLGKLHTFAYTSGRDYLVVQAWREQSGYTLPILASGPDQSLAYRIPPASSAMVDRKAGWRPSAAENLLHVNAARDYLLSAVKQAPNDPACHLALGFFLESTAHISSSIDSITIADHEGLALADDSDWVKVIADLGGAGWEMPNVIGLDEELLRASTLLRIANELRLDSRSLIASRCSALIREFWIRLAVLHYEHSIAINTGREVLHFGERPRDLVSYEAAEGVLRCLAMSTASESAKDHIAQAARDVLSKLESLPLKTREDRAISPIVFSLHSNDLAKMVDNDADVCFDLDGDGIVDGGAWVSPAAYFLVWDPNQSGSVRSGRQLFGGSSWGLFPSDGYVALSMLDDDGDGFLTRTELDGISAWQDRNGNGISEPGECISVALLGCAAVSCIADGSYEGMLSATHGIVMSDGFVCSTYDWIAKRH